MAKVKARLTLWPDRDHEVEEGELPGLRAQGLLIEDPPDAAKAAPDKPAGKPAGKAAAPAGPADKE